MARRHAALSRAAVAACLLLLADSAVASNHRHRASAFPRRTPSTCRRSSDIVYISFERPELYEHVASYHTARAVAGKARVHHLNVINTHTFEYSSRRESADTSTIYAGLDVRRVDMDMAQITGYTDLWRHYMHSSTNGRDYEMLCIARFLGLREFCMTSGIDVFTHLDGDLALFDDAVLDAMCIPPNHTAWHSSRVGTFLSTWTCGEVGLFADFLLRFYVRANRTQVAVDISRAGAPDPIDDSRRAEIESEAPAFQAAGVAPHHISDMHLLAAFYAGDHAAGHAQRHAPQPYFHRDVHTEHDNFTPLENIRYLVDPSLTQLVCDDEDIFDAQIRLTPTEQQYRSSNGTWHRLQGAHFQGSECKAHLVRTLGEPVLALMRQPQA